MRILVFGAGVIGTIYGQALAAAGNDVTHFVRLGKKRALEGGVRMRLLDARGPKPVERDVVYRPKVTEGANEGDPYDLWLVSVRHYQLDDVLPVIRERSGNADVMFFHNLWAGLDVIDRHLPRERYLWGFPVAGGGYVDGELRATLMSKVRVAEVDGGETPRLQRMKELFAGAGLAPEAQERIEHWLWVHFALNAGLVGARFKAGGVGKLLASIPDLRLGILATREALDVCAARGVDVRAFDDTKALYMPSWLAAVAGSFMMRTNRARRSIAEGHAAEDDLRRMYYDVLETARALGVPMSRYESLKPWVDGAKR